MSVVERPLIVPVYSPFLKQNITGSSMLNLDSTTYQKANKGHDATVLLKRKSLENMEPFNLDDPPSSNQRIDTTSSKSKISEAEFAVTRTSSGTGTVSALVQKRTNSNNTTAGRENRYSREVVLAECSELSTITHTSNFATSEAMLSRKESEEDDTSSILLAGSIASTIPDRYGFFGGSQYTDEKEPIPVAVLRRREMKWLQMIQKWPNYMRYRYKKIRERCRKGIPSSVRSKAWFYLCGGNELMKQNPGKFQEYLSHDGDPKWIDDIRKDLHRQFPWHEMFAEPSGHGQEELFRVLKAYTVRYPLEGYSQAQAPVAAMLVMHMPAEQAFWCLVRICESYIPGYYSEGMEAIQADGDILFALLKKVASSLYRHMAKQKIDPVLYMMEWFLCIYTRTLPWPSVLRIWDMFLCEGVKVLFRVGLVLLKCSFTRSGALKKCPTMVETIEVLRNLPAEITEENFLVNQVLKLPITDEDLQRTDIKVTAKRKASRKTE